MAPDSEPDISGLVAEAVDLATAWNFSQTELDNGMTAYTKPVYGKNGSITSVIFLFPFGDPSFNTIMMEIVAYLPVVVPEKDRPRVADFVARMGQSMVAFAQMDMESGVVSAKQRIFLKDHVFPRELMARIGDQVHAEADLLLPVLNRMIYNNLSAKDAMQEMDAGLGYTSG